MFSNKILIAVLTVCSVVVFSFSTVTAGDLTPGSDPENPDKIQTMLDTDPILNQLENEWNPLESDAGQIEYLSSFLWTSINDIDIENNNMFVATEFGIIIMDISSGPPFDTLSTIYMPGEYESWSNVELGDDDYMYVSRGEEGVFIVDISDITNPYIVGSHPARGDVLSSTYADGLLYLSEWDAGITILDVSDPAHPVELFASSDLEEPVQVRHIAIRDTVAFVSAETWWYTMIVSDPTNPIIAASGNSGFGTMNAVLDDSLAYIANRWPTDSLLIFNLKDPYNPVQVGSFESEYYDYRYDINLIDTIVFFKGNIINVSDPTSPVLINNFRPDYGGVYGTIVHNRQIYVARNRWVLVYDVSDFENPYYVNSHDIASYTYNILVNDTLLYVKNFNDLKILNTIDIENPVIIGTLSGIDYYFGRMSLNNDVLYVGKFLVDVSNPAAPAIIGTLEITDEIIDVQARENLAFLACVDNDLLVYDVTQPSAPQYLSTYSVDLGSYEGRIICVQDTMVYLATQQGVHIINYSEPANPVNVAIYGSSTYRTLDIQDDLACFDSYDLEFVDVSDPANPVRLGIYDDYFDYPNQITMQGDYLYAAYRYQHLKIFDILDPASPELLEIFPTPNSLVDFSYHDSILYLNGWTGLMVVSNPYANTVTHSVTLDIKPNFCPNYQIIREQYRRRNTMVIPAAIAGTADFDVRDIDPETVRLNGIKPVNWSYEDVTSPVDRSEDSCACGFPGGDGFEDLSLMFYISEVAKQLDYDDIEEPVMFNLVGRLGNGDRIEGSDCIDFLVVEQTENPHMLSKWKEDEAVILEGNFPNPFNPVTEISFNLTSACDVTLEIFNILGQRVTVLLDGYFEAGNHRVSWNGLSYASGVYFYRLKAGEFVETRKMVLLK